ncbi:F-box/kelch-repeat protein [Zea mays]|uniref:F-box/kelch-repeat protein n=1 Tax=Zea mays TaxID=4577 RepID=A0A3L6EYR3_MAIZE|nr:F-box/kelch-repeat protein [Zea mays]
MLGDQRMILGLDSATSSSTAPDLTRAEEDPSVSRSCVIDRLQVGWAQKGGQVEGLVNCYSKKNKTGSGSRNLAARAWSSEMEGSDEGGEVNTGDLIGGIGRELAISCLLRLPRSYYYDVACVNRSFYSLVRFGELYRLRREAGIVEQMIYCSCNVLEWEGFDPRRQRWFSIPSMPPIECFTLADKESLAVGTNILVFGKRVEAHVVLRYSLLTNSWTTGEMMNTPRCLFGSASFGEKAIVAGGIGQNGTLDSAELYDSEMQTWTTLPSMNRARQMCSGFFMDGKFYVIGGKSERHNEILSCAEEFDLESSTWRLIPDMAQGLNGGSGAPPLVAVVNNELYAADYATKEVRKYDKENNAWITLGLLPGRYTSVHGWGIAFRSCGNMLIVIGAMSAGGSGVIEICSWVPNNGLPDWKIIGTRRSGSFVYNCAVMSC